MNPVTYLCFTLMSILIQFCLMDVTILRNDKDAIGFNSSAKLRSNEMFKRIAAKPHALYYRTERAVTDGLRMATPYSNASVTEGASFTTTEVVPFEVDDVYEDNNSTLSDGIATTDAVFTSTELDNTTEITFLFKTSTVKPMVQSKRTKKQDGCLCDLSYQVCDINCQCDDDCTENEMKLFKCRQDHPESCHKEKNMHHLECGSNMFERFFCVVKVNLPDKKDIPLNKADPKVINRVQKWRRFEKTQSELDIKKTIYRIGDPLMVLQGGKLHTVDLPITVTNNYCKGTKPVRLLVDEDLRCFVKLKHLLSLQILKTSHQTNIVSFPEELNSTALNCSSVLCANWTSIVCGEERCGGYDKQLHDPRCTDDYCYNVVHQIEYAFYCNESGVINATVVLYVRQISTASNFVTQDVRVRFYMTNNSIEHVVTLSGNPGYIVGLPVIASYVQSNHTRNFFNSTDRERHMLLPYSRDGKCLSNSITHNKLLFGQNKRISCRLSIERAKVINGSESCGKIQEKLVEAAHLDRDIYISPFGKPPDNDEWLLLEKSLVRSTLYGDHRARDSKLLCYNIIARFSFTIVFIEVGRYAKENKIVTASVTGTPRNFTFSTNEDYTVATSVDVRFIDGSGAAARVYAGPPHLNVHLPKNFFLPFY